MSIRPATGTSERDRVGPYVLVKAIGAGGSARVDLARIERAYGFQRHVVIKRPLEHLRADARAAESLRREARLGARLRHPNLVAILDAGVHDNYDYLVLDYVHGGSLRELMQADEASRVRDVSIEVALTIVRDVARGVHEAHELKDDHGAPLGLVHRDVSPGNVLIGLDGAVKLADFGIAKETRVATLSGSMHGTVTYMAPEQCRGHAFDRRADVFSLGVILYELITGTRLFWADNDVASLHRVLAGTIPRPKKIRPSVPGHLDELIMSALAPEQDRRLPTARAMADAVETYATDAGLILASRGVARWAHELLGPRDAPWIGDNTVIDIMPAPPPMVEEPHPSLVALIESAPDGDEALAPTFGPTEAGLFEDSPTDRERQPVVKPRRRRGALVAAILGAALVTGGAIAFFTSRPGGDGATGRAGAPATEPPSQVVEPEASNAAADEEEGAETDPAVDDGDGEIATTDEVAPATGMPTRRKHKRRPKRATKTVTQPASGSAASKTAPKVEWDPTMLMPTDKQKQR